MPGCCDNVDGVLPIIGDRPEGASHRPRRGQNATENAVVRPLIRHFGRVCPSSGRNHCSRPSGTSREIAFVLASSALSSAGLTPKAEGPPAPRMIARDGA